MSPMRLKPARAMSATAFSSRPSAASGRSWKSLTNALSLRARARSPAPKTSPAPRRRADCRRADRDGYSCAASRARHPRSAPPRPRTDGRRRKCRASARRGHRARRVGCSGSPNRRGASRSCASSRGSASTTTRAGKRARASASERPRLKPSRAAAASRQTSLCALSTLATAASGAACQRCLAAARDRSPDAAAREREIAWSSTASQSHVLFRHSKRMTRPHRKPEQALASARGAP